MRYLFRDCELDSAAYELRVGGELRRVEPQVFDLLCLLAENPGRLLSRDELIEQVWAGRIVSDATVSARINAARKAVGDDGARQEVIRTVPRRGIKFVVEVERALPEEVQAQASSLRAEAAQKVRYCRSADSTKLAVGTSGSGPLLLRAGHWLTHLQHDWQSPIWRPFLSKLGESFTLVRYDQRGNGLSDRNVEDISLEVFVADLAAVADSAELERFPIYATSQGVPVAIAFAARYPERVSALVLHGGYARGRLLRSEDARSEAEAYLALMRQGWGAEGSHFLQAFASIFIPDGTTDQIRSLVDLQKISASADNAVRLRRCFDSLDVSGYLQQVQAPCLVVHGRNDGVHPLQGSLDIATAVPNAELLLLETRNHVLLEQDPAWQEFFNALKDFLA